MHANRELHKRAPLSNLMAVVDPVGMGSQQHVTIHVHISSPWRQHSTRTLRLAPGSCEINIARLEHLVAVKALKWATTAHQEGVEEDAYSDLLLDAVQVPQGHQHVWILAKSTGSCPAGSLKAAVVKGVLLVAKFEAYMLLRRPVARRLVRLAARFGLQFAERHWVGIAEVAGPVVAEEVLPTIGHS